jgi:TonB family protein
MTMKATFTLIAVLLLNLSAVGADPEPFLKSSLMPFYPPLCRQARIQGQVILHFTVNEQGDTSDVEAVTGPPLLQRAAIDAVQSWKFAWDHPCACLVKKKVVFVYTLGDWVDDDGPSSVVKWIGRRPVTRVEIQAGATSVQTSSSKSCQRKRPI